MRYYCSIQYTAVLSPLMDSPEKTTPKMNPVMSKSIGSKVKVITAFSSFLKRFLIRLFINER